jgi:hypothetical protein
MGQILFAPHTARILNQFTPVWGKGTATFPLFKPGEEALSEAVELTFENSSDFKRVGRQIVLETVQFPRESLQKLAKRTLGEIVEMSDEELKEQDYNKTVAKVIKKMRESHYVNVTPTADRGWRFSPRSRFFKDNDSELIALMYGYPDGKILDLRLNPPNAEDHDMTLSLRLGTWTATLILTVDSQGRVITDMFYFSFREKEIALLAGALGLSPETRLSQIASVLSAAIYDSGQYVSSELKGRLRRTHPYRRTQPYEIDWRKDDRILNLLFKRPKKRKENTLMGLVPELEKILIPATQST